MSKALDAVAYVRKQVNRMDVRKKLDLIQSEIERMEKPAPKPKPKPKPKPAPVK